MDVSKRVALVAHDNRKNDLVEWVEWNRDALLQHRLICTGTTGRLVEEEISKKLLKGEKLTYGITKLKSGPFGGDQQLGAMTADFLISSVLMREPYTQKITDYSRYIDRSIPPL